MEELQTKITSYVSKANLSKFFAPGDQFLADVASAADALRQNPSETFRSEDNIVRLTRLALYQPVIYCDDSRSMRFSSTSTSGSQLGTRYEVMVALVKRMSRICTRLVPAGTGVELRFVNSNIAGQYKANEIEKLLKDISLKAGSKLGTRLDAKILTPLVYDVINRGDRLQRPILVCTITDGNPFGEPASLFKASILRCREFLVEKGYDPSAVKFLISQIGDDREATRFLKDLSEDEDLQDMLYCTSDRLDHEFAELRQNEHRLDEWLLKTLTMPIIEAAEEIRRNGAAQGED